MRFRSAIALALTAGFGAVCALLLIASPQQTLAQSGAATGEWSRPLPISGALPGSWYPSVAVTDDGIITVIWTLTQNNQDTIFLTQKNAVAWSRPIDILIGGRHADLRLDGRNLLHLLYGAGGGVWASDAPVEKATTVNNWNEPLQLSRLPAVTGEFLTSADGNLHALWQEQDSTQKTGQVIYNQSVDSGAAWDMTRIVGENALENSRARLTRGADGALYALWRARSIKTNTNGIEINVSASNGDIWQDTPNALALTDADILQPALAVDKNNALVLVYNFGVKDETFFQISTDRGVTWSEQQAIPGLFATNPATGNDYFAAANDSAGIVHLVAVGRKSKDQPAPGLYHLTWDGARWSAPQELYQAGNFIEFPDVFISNGNRLHVVFSTRSRNQLSGAPDESYQVWYTEAVTDAPAATRVPLPTLTSQPTATRTIEASAEPTRRPTATRIPLEKTDDTAALATIDPLTPLIAAIVPVVLLLVVVLVFTFVLRMRR